jgi:hypothetical protein
MSDADREPAEDKAPPHYIGGPWDGEVVRIEPGWPPPDAIEHAGHPEGRYLKDAAAGYRWRAHKDGAH